jgi:mono/diheme cytochrome c family protein
MRNAQHLASRRLARAACALAAAAVTAAGDATAAEGSGADPAGDIVVADPRVDEILRLEGSVERGHALYAAACQACHLASGRGVAEGGVGRDLVAWRGSHGDRAAVVAILGGRPGMPVFRATLTDAQIADLLAWLRRGLSP